MYDMYRLTNEADSNPHRGQKKEVHRGWVGSFLFIYLPVFLLVVLIRAGMLVSGFSIMRLRFVDSYIWQGIAYLKTFQF